MRTTTSETERAAATEPVVTTIKVAIKPYDGVTEAMVRAWVRRGELPAVKAGKSYLIAPADLAARLRPRLREPVTKVGRESETARITRQLREAGVTT